MANREFVIGCTPQEKFATLRHRRFTMPPNTDRSPYCNVIPACQQLVRTIMRSLQTLLILTASAYCRNVLREMRLCVTLT